MATKHLQRAVMLAILAVISLGWPQIAFAQVSTGIQGRVMDDSGGVLPGVSITATSPTLQGSRFATSDGEGRYRLPDLPSGVYRVTFELAGFQTVVRDELGLGLGQIVTYEPRLALSELAETITVSGQAPVVDVRTTAAATNVTSEMIAALPVSRNIGGIVGLAPGTRGNASYGVSGRRSDIIDGIQARDTFPYPDMGSIEEVQVRVAGNDAEIAVPGVNFIATLKSGGNEFHGLYYGNFAGDWSARNIDDNLRAQGLSEGTRQTLFRDTSADLGGRLIRDRLWFYASVRQVAWERTVIGYSREPGPDGLWFTADDVPGKSRESLTNLPTAKVTLQAATNHRFSAVYNWQQRRLPERGASAFQPWEATFDYYLPNTLAKVDWTATPTDRSIFTVFVANTRWNSNSIANVDKQPAFDLVTRRITGAAVNSIGLDSTPAGSNSERWMYNASYAYYQPSFLGGSHDVKAGFEIGQEWYNKFQHARGPGTGGAGNDVRLFTQNGAPFEVLLYNSPFLSKNNLTTQTLWVRDNWQIGQRLTLNLGVRFERYHLYLPDQSKPAGPFSEAAEFSAVKIADWKVPAPRLGLSYALTDDNRTVLKATWGRFNRIPVALDARQFNRNDYNASRYKWSDLNGNGQFDPGEQGALVSTESNLGLALKILNPDLRIAKEDNTTVHLERELWAGFATKVGYVYKKVFDQFEETNPARPFGAYNIQIQAVDPGPDGRVGTSDDGGLVTYWDYDPSLRGAAFDQARQVNTPGYTDSYHNVELTLNKRMSNRWQMLASVLATHRNTWRAGVPDTPNEEIFPKLEYWEYSYKLAGSVELPYGVTASGFYQLLSGAPRGRTVRFTTGLRQISSLTLPVESPTAHRLPDQGTLDARIEKRIRLGRGNALTVGLEMNNLFNANFVTNQQFLSGPTFGRITAVQIPRATHLTARYTF